MLDRFSSVIVKEPKRKSIIDFIDSDNEDLMLEEEEDKEDISES